MFALELFLGALALAASVMHTAPVVMDVPNMAGGSYLVTVYPGLTDGINGDLNCDDDIRPGDVIELADHWVDQTTPASCPSSPATATIVDATFPDFGFTRYDQISPTQAKVSFVDLNRIYEADTDKPFTVFTLVFDLDVAATIPFTVECLQCDDDAGNAIDMPLIVGQVR